MQLSKLCAVGAVAVLAGFGTFALGTDSAKAVECLNGGAGPDPAGNDDDFRNNTACGENANASGTASTAVGANSNATRVEASAFGHRAQATGLQSTAIGSATDASGQGASAFGVSAESLGVRSTAIGGFSTAEQTNSSALGFFARAAGEASTAIGADSDATQENASAFGYNAQATGSASTAVGAGSEASEGNASAFGHGAQALHSNATAIGAGASTSRDNQMVYGTTSNTHTMAGLTSQASLDAQGPVHGFVTTDADGNLASDGGAALNQINTNTSNIAALSDRIDGAVGVLNKRDDELAEGIATALALQQPIFQPGQDFAIRFGYGNFDGSDAFGAVAAGVVARNFGSPTGTVTVDAGVGVGANEGTVAARSGVTFGW